MRRRTGRRGRKVVLECSLFAVAARVVFLRSLPYDLCGRGRWRVWTGVIVFSPWAHLMTLARAGVGIPTITTTAFFLFFFRVLDLTAENNPPISGRKKPCP